MGTVHRAERVKLGRAVAIKFLQPAFARQPDFVRRFEREALAMSRIYHPHCVSIIDYGMHEDSPYLVMEYIPGRSLSRILRDGPLPARRAVRIVQQVLDTLGYFHRRNVLHRDLKAENIMIAGDEDDDGQDYVKLLDLGMAKLLAGVGADINVSKKGIVVGTPSAMSPEQIRELPLDARSDLYSTGVLLYHMLVGRRPFQGDDMVAVFKMHLETPVTPPSEILGTRAISRELDAVVLKALAKDRDERFPDAAAMSAALEATREGRAHEPAARRASTVAASGRVPVASTSRPWLAWSGWAVAAALGGLVAVQHLRGGEAPAAPAAEPPAVVAAAPAPDAGAPTVAEPLAAMPDAGDTGDTGAPLVVAPTDPVDAATDVAVTVDAGVDATAATAATSQPWTAALDDTRARLARKDYRGALKTITAATRATPEARTDPEVVRAAYATLAAPYGDQFIPTLIRDVGRGPLVGDTLAAAMTGADTWYERHHAWQALHKTGHGARADLVALWIADFERADTCDAARRAHSILRTNRDKRAAALRAALADDADPRYATQRACLR